MRHLANQQWLKSTYVSKVVKNHGKKTLNVPTHPQHCWKINTGNALVQWHPQLTVSQIAANTGMPTESYLKNMAENLGTCHLFTEFNNFSWLNEDKIQLPFTQTLCNKLKQIIT
jgi:PPE-repeat protein